MELSPLYSLYNLSISIYISSILVYKRLTISADHLGDCKGALGECQ